MNIELDDRSNPPGTPNANLIGNAGEKVTAGSLKQS